MNRLRILVIISCILQLVATTRRPNTVANRLRPNTMANRLRPNTMANHLSNFILDHSTKENPDVNLPVPKIIRRNGYPVEMHIVESADGYFLEVHRIPHGRNKITTIKKETPILLQHGILCTSYDWLINGPEKSLGYILADLGYDVWLGNMRGNTYSKGHVYKNPKHKDYWDFSFHESGYYDLPAVIDHILRVTNSTQIIYIGYSMGTTIFYVMCSTRPEYNQKVKLHIGLAPVASITYNKSFLRYLIPSANKIQKLAEFYSGGAVLDQNFLIRFGSKLLCTREIFYTNICFTLIMESFFGSNPHGINKTMIPTIMSHTPAGTSVKTLVHFAQTYVKDKFQQYDYGIEGNRITYNQSTPPRYNLNKVMVPSALYYGQNDLLSDPRDVKLLYHRLPRPVVLHKVKDNLFTHLDFVINNGINPLLNYPILSLIEKSQKPGYLDERVAGAIKERWEAIKAYPWYVNVMEKNTTSNSKPASTEENSIDAYSGEDDTNRRILLQKRNSNRSIQIIHNEYRKNLQMVTVR